MRYKYQCGRQGDSEFKKDPVFMLKKYKLVSRFKALVWGFFSEKFIFY